MLNFKCPRDGHKLIQSTVPTDYNCSKCHGLFLLSKKTYQKIENRFHRLHAFKSLKCPCCNEDMVPYHFDQGSLELDLCSSCHGAWFDAKEKNHFYRFMIKWVERVDTSRKISERRKKPQKQTKQEKELYDQYREVSGLSAETTTVETFLQLFFSLPIEKNIPSFKSPVVTLGLIFINIAVLVSAYWKVGMPYFEDWVFRPAQWTLSSLFNSIFSHGSVFHLVGNMYFLYITGDNVEDLMGRFKYFTFYIVCGFAASIIYVFMGAEGSFLGASGAISGVMGAYVCFFPKSKFAIRILWILEIEVSCLALFLFYIGIDIISMKFADGVAHEAHIVGFIVGYIIALLFKRTHLV